MITEHMTAQEVFLQYKDDMEKLIAYLPWLEEKSGKSQVSTNYGGDELSPTTISFPVYDGTLLRFIREADTTQFMDRNYPYVITDYYKIEIDEDIEMVESIARKIGFVKSGEIDYNKTCEKIYNDLINGKVANITLDICK